jgi:hypothetical protein
MPVSNYLEAIDNIFDHLYSHHQSVSPAIIGYEPEIRWWDVDGETKPNVHRFWVQVAQETTSDTRRTIGKNTTGESCFRATGILMITIFATKHDVSGGRKSRELAQSYKDRFRTDANGIFFRESKIVEMKPEEDWLKIGVMVSYEYDEV